MQVSNMFLQGAIRLAVAATFFATLMVDFATACDTCVAHKASLAVPPENFGTLAGVVGVALVCTAAYGIRQMLAQK